jgi:WD40 repeat protein
MPGLFRVFISSTFDDFEDERNTLISEVFPVVTAACQARSLQFQPMDLRWGISDDLVRDHRTMSICLEELRRADAVLVLAGDRFGWRPLPASLTVETVDRIAAAGMPGADLVQAWYELDRNAVPAHCALKTAQHFSIDEWSETEYALRTALSSAAEAMGAMAPAEVRSCELSATEQEVRLAHWMKKPTCALIRTFADYSTVPLRPYLDAKDGVWDRGTHAHQLAFKESLLASSPEAKEFRGDYAARSHIPPLCAAARAFLLERVGSHSGSASAASADDRVHSERTFVGRSQELARIAHHLTSGPSAPLAILGTIGSGKSSLLSHLAHQVPRLVPGASVLPVFAGRDEQVSDVRSLLRKLCHASGLQSGATAIYQLTDELWRTWETPRVAPLVVVLDGLDQILSREEDLAWLPRLLPAQIRVVVSCATGTIADLLRARLPGLTIELGALDASEADQLLDSWLAADNRTLQPAQRRLIRSHFQQDPRPLFLRLIYEDARLWHSEQNPFLPASDARSHLLHHLTRLRARYGDQLVDSGLAYVQASREGLSEFELLDLLSLDEEVMREFSRRWYHTGKVTRLPTALWARFAQDLGPFTAEREVAGLVLMTLFHRQLLEIVDEDCYRPQSNRFHTNLKSYFGSEALLGTPSRRSLTEWPRHQIRCDDLDALDIEQTLLNLDFLEKRVTAGLIEETAEDFSMLQARLENHRGELRATVHELGRAFDSELRVIQAAPDLAGSQIFNNLVARGGTDATGRRMLDRYVAYRRSDAHGRPWLRRLNASPHSQSQRALRRVLTIRGQPVTHLAVTPDGRHLAAAGADGFVRLWFTANGVLVREFVAHDEGTSALTVFSEGKDGGLMIVTAGRTTGVRIWDPNGQRPLAETGPLAARVYGLNVGPLSRRIYGALDDRTLRVWNRDGREVDVLRGHTDRVLSLALNDDETIAVSGGDDLILRVWDIGSLRPPRALGGHVGPIRSVALSGDGRWALSASDDGTVKTWDLVTGKLVSSHEEHRSVVRAVSFLGQPENTCAGPGGSVDFASGGDDETVRTWRSGTGRARTMFVGISRGVNALAADPRGRWLTAAAEDGLIRTWMSVETESSTQHLSHDGPVTAMVRLSNDAPVVASAGDDGVIRTWDATNGSLLSILRDHRQTVASLVALPKGRLASGGLDRSVRIWNTRSGRMEFSLAKEYPNIDNDIAARVPSEDLPAFIGGRSEEITAMAMCGRVGVLAASPDRTVRLWDSANGKELATFDKGPTLPQSLLWLVEADVVVAAGPEPHLVAWQRSAPKRRWIVETRGAPVACLGATASGALIVGCSDGSILGWRLKGTLAEATAVHPRAHQDGVISVAVNPRTETFVSAGRDGRVLLWREDRATSELLVAHEGIARAVMFLGDSKVLSVGDDRRVSVFDVASEPARPLATSWLNDPVTVGAAISEDSACLGTRTGEVVFIALDAGQAGGVRARA